MRAAISTLLAVTYSIESSQKISFGLVENELSIECYDAMKTIGFLYYKKIPLVPYYVLYNFYMEPTHRHRGYGTQLLNHACDYLALHGASKIYIQPGPFEIHEEKFIAMPSYDRELRLKKLIKLYADNQFVFVNKALRLLAHVAYKFMEINEDSDYLMVRVLQ